MQERQNMIAVDSRDTINQLHFSHSSIEKSRTVIPTLIEAIQAEVSDNQVEDVAKSRKLCIRSRSDQEIVNINNSDGDDGSATTRRAVNVDYFYRLLFTRDNLKLVHIVCHNKQEHWTEKCDELKVFIDVAAAAATTDVNNNSASVQNEVSNNKTTLLLFVVIFAVWIVHRVVNGSFIMLALK